MQLKKEYSHFEELYKAGWAFNPEEEIVYHTKKGKAPVLPPLFEGWKIEPLDLNEYCKQRLEELGISDQDNTIELIGGVNLQSKEKCEQKVFLANSRGDIEILQYGLNRVPYLEGSKRERYVYQTRLHPWHELLCEGKYDFTFGKNAPFWHKSLIEMYKDETPCDTLTITEGQIKAFKASNDGIPTVGLTSISHFKKEGKIHQELIDFIRVCKVKNLVILWDGDCRDISLNELTLGNDISKRPSLFFAFARKIKELIKDFPVAKKLNVFFATIESAALNNNPKGIDDLLIEFKEHRQEVVSDFAGIGQRPGKYIEWIDITQETGIKKMRSFFMLHSVQEFYQFHQAKIRNHSFVYHGSTYKIEKGHPVVEVSADIKCFKRIGFDYYRLKMTPKIAGFNGETVLEEELVPWQKGAFVDDHTNAKLSQIERFDGFVNVASHTDYRPVIDQHWNLYYDVKHNIAEGEFPHITKLLKHIFEEHYDNEMILDYLTILYRFPIRKLPVICLVSKKQNTGKSTFIYLLKLLFKQNMSIISNNDLTGDFNSHWTAKLVVASEETLLEKKDGYEKIKSLSTAKYITRNEKNKTAQDIDCMLHFVFCSNHENDFIKIDDEDSRLWIRKVRPKTEKIKGFDRKLEDEIGHFVHFIANREIKYQDTGERLYFEPKDFRTDAFDNVAKHSEPSVIKELRLHLEESFLKFGGHTRMMTAENISKYFGIRGEKHYLNKTIKEYLVVERLKDKNGKDASTTYSFSVSDPLDSRVELMIHDKGRPFVFHAHQFTNEEDLPMTAHQQEMNLDNEKNDTQMDAPDDDLPF